MSIYSNVCSADCRGSCRIKTTVQDDKIVGINGDPLDKYTLGSLCAKGYAQMYRLYSPNRVTHPMKQIGKGTGNWVYISWEQTLTEIAQKLIEIKNEYNNLLPVCLNKYLGTMGVLSRSIEGFFNSIGYITKMVDSPCIANGMDAMNLSFGTSKKPTPEDMANAKVIIIWGGNPAWTTSHQMRFVYKAQQNGAVVIVIDPVLTATAARSDYYIQIKPGTDLELALGIAKVLVDEQLVDNDFVDNYSNGWQEFKNILDSVELSEIAKTTEIPHDQIRNLAQIIGNTKPMTFWLGAGVQHTQRGGQAFRLFSALSAMTGNVGIAGGNIHYATFEAWKFAGEFESLKPPKEMVNNNKDNSNVVTKHRRIGTGRYTELMSLEPPIELLWIASHNPAAQAPDSNTVKNALKSINTVVVVDNFITSSAEYADYILPVTFPFEQEDIVVSYWHYGAAVNQQAITPAGESKSDFQIMRELAKRLNEMSPQFSTFPVDRSAAEWLDLEMKPQYPKLGINHYQELIENYKRINLPGVPWQEKNFSTPSGKFEFPMTLNLDSTNNFDTRIYPYRLLRERSYSTHNSQFRNASCVKGLSEKTSAVINSQIAKFKGLEEGARIKLFNHLAEIELPVLVSDSVSTDVVVVRLGCDYKDYPELNNIVALINTDLGDCYSDDKGLAYNNSYVDIMRA